MWQLLRFTSSLVSLVGNTSHSFSIQYTLQGIDGQQLARRSKFKEFNVGWIDSNDFLLVLLMKVCKNNKERKNNGK